MVGPPTGGVNEAAGGGARAGPHEVYTVNALTLYLQVMYTVAEGGVQTAFD